MLAKKKLQSGQAFTEFALTLLLFLLLVLIIVDLGRITYTYSALLNAAREGARYGIINPEDDTEIVNHVKEYAIGLDASKLTVSVSQPDNKTIQVATQYSFSTASPILSILTGSESFNLVATSQMRIEK